MVIKVNYHHLLLIDMLCIIRNIYYFIPLQSAKKRFYFKQFVLFWNKFKIPIILIGTQIFVFSLILNDGT